MAVVMAWFVPYRVPLFRELALMDGVDLTVIFCSAVEEGRDWTVPQDLPFNAVFLRPGPGVRYRYRHLFGESNSIRYPAGLLRALREIDPDVLVGYEFRPECIAAAVYALVHRKAYIVWSDITGLLDARLGVLRRWVRRAILSKSKAVIGSSSDTLDHFGETFGYPRERMVLSILSAHLDDFAAIPTVALSWEGSPDGAVRFVFSGRLVSLKGLDSLIRAFVDVKKHLAGAVLTILGDGPERSRLEDLAAQSGLRESIFFKGALPHARMAEELLRHDVFVFPTRLDVFGLSVAEAVACGLPVICSKNAGAARDLVRQNGVTFNPDRLDELTVAMVRLGRDPDLRRSMAEASKAVAAGHGLANAVAGFREALALACPNLSPMPRQQVGTGVEGPEIAQTELTWGEKRVHS